MGDRKKEVKWNDEEEGKTGGEMFTKKQDRERERERERLNIELIFTSTSPPLSLTLFLLPSLFRQH